MATTSGNVPYLLKQGVKAHPAPAKPVTGPSTVKVTRSPRPGK